MNGKNIDKEKYYTPSDVTAEGFFPWIKTYLSVLNFLRKQYELDNGEKFSITFKEGETRYGDRYFIKGEGIIKVVEAFESGTLSARK